MLLSSSALWVLVGALIVDALIGDPAWLWRRVPHPVTWLGALVDGLDGGLNRITWSEGLRRGAGALALLLLVAIGAWIGWEIETGLRRIPYGEIPLAIVASVFLAQRSLYQHVGAVHAAFGTGGLTEARRAVSQIVGRDPASLDESGVSRAAIEILRGELFRRRGRAGVLVRAVRIARADRLQGGQHRRLDDRPSHGAPRSVRLGIGAFRRSRQSASRRGFPAC